MTTKLATTDDLTRGDVRFLAVIDKHLAQIKATRRDIVRRRAAGRRISASIRRQHQEIRDVLSRVQTTR